MTISQRLNFTTLLNRRKPIKDKTQIKIVCKFERLVVLLPSQLCILYNFEAVRGVFLVAE